MFRYPLHIDKTSLQQPKDKKQFSQIAIHYYAIIRELKLIENVAFCVGYLLRLS